MTIIRSKNLIVVKGFLYLFASLFAALILISRHPNLEFIFLLLVSMFCAARFYFFAFHVMTRYVDDDYEFNGIISFFLYFIKRRTPSNRPQ